LSEFAYGGEAHDMPSPQQTDARAWAEYVFFHDNPAGAVTEWWCHTPTSYWFLVDRNTLTNDVIRTYAPIERYSERVDFVAQNAGGGDAGESDL